MLPCQGRLSVSEYHCRGADSSELHSYPGSRANISTPWAISNCKRGVIRLYLALITRTMDSGRNGDAAWPLWGLVIRTVQAMGLHRDGRRWNLPDADIEERR